MVLYAAGYWPGKVDSEVRIIEHWEWEMWGMWNRHIVGWIELGR